MVEGLNCTQLMPSSAATPSMLFRNDYANDYTSQSLTELARKLAKEGPVRTLQTPRLVRILLGGEYIVQTTDALFIWEHPYYPQYYLPKSTILDSKAPNLKVSQGSGIKNDEGQTVAHRYTLSVGKRSTDECIIFASDLSGPAKVLNGLAKINFNAVDRWVEEAMPIHVHPKDPYKRVDILPSTRRVQVFVGKVKVADTTSSMHLYETGLPCRYYLPLTDVDVAKLLPSKTKTQCPYKGEAEYYSVDTGEGDVAKDVVWYYERPTLECAKIEGKLIMILCVGHGHSRGHRIRVLIKNSHIQDFCASTTKRSTSRLTTSGWKGRRRLSAEECTR